MPYLETPPELAEELADMLGINGCVPEGCDGNSPDLDVDHPGDCKCRLCFTIDITERIRQVVKNEARLSVMGNFEKD